MFLKNRNRKWQKRNEKLKIPKLNGDTQKEKKATRQNMTSRLSSGASPPSSFLTLDSVSQSHHLKLGTV